jgi:hypothetical protein
MIALITDKIAAWFVFFLWTAFAAYEWYSFRNEAQRWW